MRTELEELLVMIFLRARFVPTRVYRLNERAMGTFCERDSGSVPLEIEDEEPNDADCNKCMVVFGVRYIC